MATKGGHVAEDPNVLALGPDAHFKGAVLDLGQRGQGLETPQPGLRGDDLACCAGRSEASEAFCAPSRPSSMG